MSEDADAGARITQADDADGTAVNFDGRRVPPDTQSAPGDLAVLSVRPTKKSHLAATAAVADDLPEIEILDPDELGVDPASLQTQCGISRYRPKCLQRFATKNWMLFWMCWYCTVQGLLVNGLVPSSISTIERRFQLSMSTIGRVMQFYDFGYVLFCIPVSYFGGRHSKPLFLGLGLLVMGIGSFLFAMPHNISEAYTSTYNSEEGDLSQCHRSSPTTLHAGGLNGSTSADFLAMTSCRSAVKQSGSFRYVFLFCLAHFLHGVGATPLFTLGVSYIDENVKPSLSSLYLGVFYAFAIFGPAIGFLKSGTFLRYHTDFLQAERQTAIINIDESDPKWVGAWWIGFLIASILAMIAVFPILSFPKMLPDAVRWHRIRAHSFAAGDHTDPTTSAAPASGPLLDRLEDASDASVSKKEPIAELVSESTKATPVWYKFWLDIRHIPIAVYRLLTNGSYMLITLGMAVDGLIIAGASTFMSKYLERQFNVAPSRANMLIGCIMVPMAGIGTMFSGFLVQHFRMTCRKTLQLCVAMVVLSLILSPMYLIYCDHDKLVGIETNYPDLEKWPKTRMDSNVSGEPSLFAKCNGHCQCLVSEFHPVCAEFDGQQMPFYSPCFAGCSEKYEPMRKEYHNCSCVPPSKRGSRKVKNGYCESKCSGLVGFLVLFAPFIFCTFAVGVPLISVVLRTVDYAERSFALGIQWILVRVIGTIPAPVLFGWMFDVSCIRRHLDPCTGQDGSCYLYYNKLLADLFLAFSVVGQTVTLLFLVLALVLYSGSLKDDPITVERKACES